MRDGKVHFPRKEPVSVTVSGTGAATDLQPDPIGSSIGYPGPLGPLGARHETAPDSGVSVDMIDGIVSQHPADNHIRLARLGQRRVDHHSGAIERAER